MLVIGSSGTHPAQVPSDHRVQVGGAGRVAAFRANMAGHDYSAAKAAIRQTAGTSSPGSARSRWNEVVLAAATALAPLAAFRWLPGTADHGTTTGRANGEPPLGLVRGLRQAGQLRRALVFAATTVAAGVVVSFLPLATGASSSIAAIGLLAQALTATAARWLAGCFGDRRGHARLLIPGLALAAAGMIAMTWLAAPVVVIAGMCVFGTGFGIIQNTPLALMIDRMPAAGLATASALWNLAYDAGYGAGPAVVGVFVGHTGYPAAFAVTGLLILAAGPAGRRARCKREVAVLATSQVASRASASPTSAASRGRSALALVGTCNVNCFSCTAERRGRGRAGHAVEGRCHG